MSGRTRGPDLDRRCGRASRARPAPAWGVPREASVVAPGGCLRRHRDGRRRSSASLRAGAVAAPIPAGRTAPETAAALALLEPVLFLGRGEPARGGRTLDGAGRRRPDVGHDRGAEGRGAVGRALAPSADAWLAALPPATGWLLALGLAHVAGLGVLWRAAAGARADADLPPDDPAALLAALAVTRR